MTDEEEKKISELAEALGLTDNFSAEFEICVKWITQHLATRQKLAQLPAKPKREIRTMQPVIDYIRAPDGLGPWFEAGVLTRPLIGELSPKAYGKLENYLQKNALPDDIKILGKSETVAQELEPFLSANFDITVLKAYILTTGGRLSRPNLGG